MASRHVNVLGLYKSLLRESGKFSSYNFRAFFERKIRLSFRENKNLSDPEVLKTQIEYAKKNLEIIRRQVVIDNLYSSDKLVIEK